MIECRRISNRYLKEVMKGDESHVLKADQLKWKRVLQGGRKRGRQDPSRSWPGIRMSARLDG